MLDDLELAIDIAAELRDSDYEGRKHYSRSTYADGCRGPLCRLAETHRGRTRNEERARERGSTYRPYLDRRKVEGEEVLMKIIREQGWDKPSRKAS